MDRKIEKRTWTAKRVVALVAAGVLLLLVGVPLFLYLKSSQSVGDVDRGRLSIAMVEEGDFQEYIQVRGSVLPQNTLYIDAPESGRVLEILVEEGAEVEEGQALLRLENKELELSVRGRQESLNAEINRVQELRLNHQQELLEQKREMSRLGFDIANDERRFKRLASLWEDGLVAELEYLNAKAKYEFNQASRRLLEETHTQASSLQLSRIEFQEAIVGRMEADMNLVRSRLDRLVVRAPAAGLLSSYDAEVGESKAQGQRIGKIDILDGLKVRAMADEHYLSRLDLGLEGSFSLSGQRHDLVVAKVYPEIEDGSVEMDMRFFASEPESLRRGQTLHVRLALGDLERAVLIPKGGFYQQSAGNWIFVVDSTGTRATRRAIRIGRQNTDSYEILEGLEPGERVIASSYELYSEFETLNLR